MSLTYSDYLRIDELLHLQTPKSDPPEHDEALFIIIHQVYELWFKLLLHEFDKVKRDLEGGRLFAVIATLKRARTVMKTLVGQLDILETMTPMEFMSFRDRLEAASGFQSAQFRELEFVLGHKRPAMIRYHDENPPAKERLLRRLREPSVVDAFHAFLRERGIQLPQELEERDPEAPTEPNEGVQAAVLELYRSQPEVAILLELMTDFDEGLQEWRYRHVKMVERTIGDQAGTGGSPGVQFLRKTLFQPIFPDLWAIRDQF